MSLIPSEELRRQGTVNLAPMVDFLFLVVAVFATFALTRAALFDGELQLVQVSSSASQKNTLIPHSQEDYIVNLSVTSDGHYKWVAEMNEYLMDNVAAIEQELERQQDLGLLPKEKSQTRVLLHIDKNAKWEPIAQLILAVREAGYTINPVYAPNS